MERSPVVESVLRERRRATEQKAKVSTARLKESVGEYQRRMMAVQGWL